jgi:hypothetical protein
MHVSLDILNSLGLNAQVLAENMQNKKVVILNFDDNHMNQFTQAKPILDM